jgi:hypothetical protein
MIPLAVVLGILLGTTAGPVIGGLTAATWLQVGQVALPLAKDAIVLCARTPSCSRKSVSGDFSSHNHLGMGM